MKFSDLFKHFGKDVEVHIGKEKFEGKLLPMELPAPTPDEMSSFLPSSVEEKMGTGPVESIADPVVTELPGTLHKWSGSLPALQVTTPARPRIETFSLNGAECFREIDRPERLKWADLVRRAGTSFVVPCERIGIGEPAEYGRN